MSEPTIVCELCSTVQPNAWDCAACGHPLHQRPALEVAVEVMPGIEVTGLDPAGNVALEVMPGLESTALEIPGMVADPPADAVAGLEATAFGVAGDVAADLIPDLERTALEDLPPASASAVAAPACRYCGTPWAAGGSVFCQRCGMRVPVPGAAPRAAGATDGSQACPGCGTPGQRIGSQCNACGQRVVAFGA